MLFKKTRRIFVSLHLPHSRLPFDLFSATLHEIRHQLFLFLYHKFFVGVDANVKLAGCSDGFLIGDAVLRADSSCLDRQRTGAFVEFFQDCRLMVCNTWTREVLSTRREWSSVKFDVPVGSETQCDFVLVSAGSHFSEVDFMKDIDFSSDHWPVSVLCEHSKRVQIRRNESVGGPRSPRVPLRWLPAEGFVDCVNKLDSLQGALTNQIAGWRAAACDHALPSITHVVSGELQELLSLQSVTTDVVVRRKISKSIWRLRRKERRKRASALIVSAAEAKRSWSPSLWLLEPPQLVKSFWCSGSDR